MNNHYIRVYYTRTITVHCPLYTCVRVHVSVYIICYTTVPW